MLFQKLYTFVLKHLLKCAVRNNLLCLALFCSSISIWSNEFQQKPDVLILGLLTFQTHDDLRDKFNKVLNPAGAAYPKSPQGVARARCISLPVVSEWTSCSSKSFSPLLVLLFPQQMDTKLRLYVFVKWVCVCVCQWGSVRVPAVSHAEAQWWGSKLWTSINKW